MGCRRLRRPDRRARLDFALPSPALGPDSLTELSSLVDRYARGEYRSLDELSIRYREFDKMSEALSAMGRTIREQMERWRQLNDHLELAVAERTQDLERTLVNLRHTQDSLVRSENSRRWASSSPSSPTSSTPCWE